MTSKGTYRGTCPKERPGEIGGKRKPKLPQGITKRDMAEARKEMAVWEKRLKSKDESQVLRALIHLTDARDGKVPERVVIQFNGKLNSRPKKGLGRRDSQKSDCAILRVFKRESPGVEGS